MLAPEFMNPVTEFGAEARNGKLLGMVADRLRIEHDAGFFKPPHGMADRLDALRPEMDSRYTVNDRLGGAAAAVGQHRRTAGLGLERGDAEIFLGGKNESFGPLHMLQQD